MDKIYVVHMKFKTMDWTTIEYVGPNEQEANAVFHKAMLEPKYEYGRIECWMDGKMNNAAHPTLDTYRQP